MQPLWTTLIFASLFCAISATKCQYCNKDFKVVGRHEWRCKGRITSAASSSNIGLLDLPNARADSANNSPVLDQHSVCVIAPIDTDYQTCVCGKVCKGRRGLKAHHRSCKAYESLQTHCTNPLPSSQDDLTSTPSTTPSDAPLRDQKHSIKLSYGQRKTRFKSSAI